jgi:hypothetical protein
LDDEGPPDKTILILRTLKFEKLPVTNILKQLVKDIKAGNRIAMVTGISDADNGLENVPVVDKNQTSNLMNCFHDLAPMLIFNVAKCSVKDRDYLRGDSAIATPTLS